MATSLLPTSGSATASTVHATVVTPSATPAVTSTANWLLLAQLPDGAIKEYPGPAPQAVSPYWGNYAAIGLARAFQLTKNSAYAAATWSWLSWYQAHESPTTGYVTDYQWNGSSEASTGTMDSTDAYAGTFLAATWDAYIATGDKTRLSSLLGGIQGALKAIDSTMNPNGLTNATPTYPVADLMDQSEVYGGLVAAGQIGKVLGNRTLATAGPSQAAKLKSTESSMWNSALSNYPWAVQSNGYRTPSSWSNLYPDEMAQAWAVAYGLSTTTTTAPITSRVAANQSVWSAGVQQGGYWPMAAAALNAGGNSTLAGSTSQRLFSAATSSGFAWPWMVGSAGQMIVALSGGHLVD